MKLIFKRIFSFFDRLNDKLYPFLGLSKYDDYLKHMAKNHPDTKPLSKSEFFKKMQDDRGKNVKC